MCESFVGSLGLCAEVPQTLRCLIQTWSPNRCHIGSITPVSPSACALTTPHHTHTHTSNRGGRKEAFEAQEGGERTAQRCAGGGQRRDSEGVSRNTRTHKHTRTRARVWETTVEVQPSLYTARSMNECGCEQKAASEGGRQKDRLHLHNPPQIQPGCSTYAGGGIGVCSVLFHSCVFTRALL